MARSAIRAPSECLSSARQPRFARKRPRPVPPSATMSPFSTNIHRPLPVLFLFLQRSQDLALALFELPNFGCAPGSVNPGNTSLRAPYRAPPSQSYVCETSGTPGSYLRCATRSSTSPRLVRNKPPGDRNPPATSTLPLTSLQARTQFPPSRGSFRPALPRGLLAGSLSRARFPLRPASGSPRRPCVPARAGHLPRETAHGSKIHCSATLSRLHKPRTLESLRREAETTRAPRSPPLGIS